MGKLKKVTAYVDGRALKHLRKQAKHEGVSPSAKINDLICGAFK
jgi:hypothetical protein